MVGQTIGQYRVLHRIGHGGMGTVYHAIDEMLEREVALKALDAELEDPQKRFRTEAIALARLSHPGIATVHELFQHQGRWVMVMEFVRGQTLQQIVDQIGVFSPQRAAELCMQALGALAHAHSAGVVHRDLKPSNLMVTETGVVKIMDFGIARLDGSVHLTNAGFMVGTPAYMAPEQIQGHRIDARVDLYAMGVIFYRLISAELPFRGETAFAMAQSHVHDAPTPIDLVRSDLPSWVHRIVARALAKAPEERFQSAIEFHEGFARCLAGLPLSSAGSVTEVSPRPTSTLSPGLRSNPAQLSPQAWLRSTPHAYPKSDLTARRHRVAAWIGIAVAGILVGVGASLWLQGPLNVLRPDGASVQTGTAGAPGAATDKGIESTPPPTVQTGAVPASNANIVEEPAPNTPVASATFGQVKLLVVNGAQTNDRDVMLTFSNGQIVAVPNGSTAAIATVPYRRIVKATYVHARNPRWDPLLRAPTVPINVPGFFGRSHHWLVVQTRMTYTILRLDGERWAELLSTLEARTGIKVVRVLGD